MNHEFYFNELEKLNPSNKKYFSIYKMIIERSLLRPKNKKEFTKSFGYCEKHHIFPKSFCTVEQKEDPNNLVILTYREHLICHKLLAHAFKHIHPFVRAFFAMYSARNKKQVKHIMSTADVVFFKINSSFQARIGEKNGMFGKKQSEETKEKIRVKATGRKYSEDVRKQRSIRQLGENGSFYGKHHSEESKKKLSDATRNFLLSEKNPNRKKYKFISPNGEEFISNGIWAFLKEHQLSYRHIMSNLDKGPIVLRTFKLNSLVSPLTKNCEGWQIWSIED